MLPSRLHVCIVLSVVRSHECESPCLINPLSDCLIQIICLIPKSFKALAAEEVSGAETQPQSDTFLILK